MTVQSALATVQTDVTNEITQANAAVVRAKENGDLGQEEQSVQWLFAATQTQKDLTMLASAINAPVVTPPTPSTTLVGYYNNGTPIAELGITPGLVSDYADNNATTYSYDAARTAQQASKILILGVGNITAAQAAAIGVTLVANGQSKALIRIMWEPNQHGWFASDNESAYTAAEYIAEWKIVVGGFRSVEGQAFRFVWNPTADVNGQNNLPGRTDTDTFAGTEWVDYVAVDVYDNNGSVAASVTCVNEFVTFAKSQGLEWGLCEWGLANNVDDAAFIEAIQTLCADGTCAFQALFSEVGLTSGPGTDITLAPKSLAAYRAWLG